MHAYKLKYFCASATKVLLNQGLVCPSCGTSAARVMDRKWVVTALRRCLQCNLLFRTPTTSAKENQALYQSEYQEGFTTELPSDDALQALIESNFHKHEKDYSHYIKILRLLGALPGQRLFDYGCSWGYGSFQLVRAGFAVDAYEISKSRSEYAQAKLGIRVVLPEQVEKGIYDVFFSAHVIEHVPSVADMIAFGMRCLKLGGLFIAFTPNGSESYRKCMPINWQKSWGAHHPQLIDDVFLRRHFTNKPLLATSNPYSEEIISQWDRLGHTVASISGAEMMFATRASGTAS